jgi:hypothetical protein
MIEIRPTGEDVNPDEVEDRFALFVNGEPIEQARVRAFTDPDGSRKFTVKTDDKGLRQLSNSYLSEWPTVIRTITFSCKTDSDALLFDYIKRLEKIEPDDPPVDYDLFALSYSLTTYRDDWKEAYSINEYVEEFLRLYNLANPPLELLQDHLPSDLVFSIILRSPQSTIGDEIERCTNAIIQLDREARASLLSKLREHSLLTFFDFPEEVRIPCEQYLLYFIQFLKDLGVEATGEIQQEAGQVLFSVTPTDRDTALDKIRVALEIYMRLPSSPISDSSSGEIVAQRLEANIYHLSSTLSIFDL